MAWPPSTHGDVENAVGVARAITQFPTGAFVTAPGLVTGTLAGAVGTAYYMPLFLPAGTVGDVAVRVTTAAAATSGGTVQMGLYDTSATLNSAMGRVPGARLATGTAISTETTGTKALTVAQAVSGGLYWLAVLPLVAASSMSSLGNDSQTGRVGVGTFVGSNFPAVLQSGPMPSLPTTAAPDSAAAGLRLWCSMSAVN